MNKMCFDLFLAYLSVDEVKTRTASLRTQYSRLLKPKPGGTGTKPLTARQKWLLIVMDFIKRHIVHRLCDSTVSKNTHIATKAILTIIEIMLECSYTGWHGG